MRAGQELPVHIAVAHDRSRNELWEQRHIGAEGDITALRLVLPTVQINRIGHDLKRVEGYADGQLQPLQRMQDAGERRDQPQVFDDEVCVLKEYQHRQVEHQRDHQPHPRPVPVAVPVFPDGKSAKIADRDREQHHRDIDRLVPAVKDKAQKEQRQIAPTQRHEIVNRQRQGQVGKQEYG